MFVSASDNNVKSLVERSWMFRIEARTCKCEWIYIYIIVMPKYIYCGFTPWASSLGVNETVRLDCIYYDVINMYNCGLSALSRGLIPSLRFVDVWGEVLGFVELTIKCCLDLP